MNEKTLRVLEYEKIREMLRKRAHSAVGKVHVDEMAPSSSLTEVKYMLDQTSETASILMKHNTFPLGPVHDLTSHIRVAEIGSFLYPNQLMEASDTFRTARRMKRFIEKQNHDEVLYPILGEYGGFLTEMKVVEDEIEAAIIGESEISDNASPELRRIRREMSNKNNAIRKKMDSIIQSTANQKYLQDAIVTIRQDRFVVPVKSEFKNMIKGLVHDQSGSGSTLYIEPFAVVELNNQLKQLKLDEKAEIERILTALTALIGERADQVRVNQKYLAILDFMIAKGQLSLVMEGMAPVLNDKGYVRIRNGRHPLLEAKTVVPSNMWIGDDFTTLLVTGPNTGGKTVTLKTAGLLALMTQSGLHVPADHGTEMAVFDAVYADIGDEQSIEQSLSTFSSHMTNIVEILDKVTENSFVLFDELGAGTDPTEGAALAMAILNKLYERKIRTIATTHYSELKQYAIVNEGIENASVEFDVQTLSPTYKLLIGVPGKSNAFEISSKLGLSDDLIGKARALVNHEDIAFEEILSSIEDNRKQSEQERDEAIKLRLEIEKLKKKLEEKETRLTDQKDKLVRKAKEEARAILKKAKEESEEIIKELRGMQKQGVKDRNKEIEAMRNKLRDNLNATADTLFDDQPALKKVPKNLKKGDTVRVAHLGQEGSVLTLPDAKGDLTVQVGIMKMNVNLKNLMLVDVQKEAKYASTGRKPAKGSGGGLMKSMHVRPEIDIRGQNVEEASHELDKYLDDAYLANLGQVRIIHGKGTGALKKGLQDFFKRHPHVKKAEEAAYNEGGSGVTLITLK